MPTTVVSVAYVVLLLLSETLYLFCLMIKFYDCIQNTCTKNTADLTSLSFSSLSSIISIQAGLPVSTFVGVMPLS